MTARQLAAEHLWIVHNQAQSFRGDVAYADLCGIGSVALMEAARKWKQFEKTNGNGFHLPPSRKSAKASARGIVWTKFGAFASQRIKWRMLDAVRRYKELPQESENATDDGEFGRMAFTYRSLERIAELNGDDLDDRAHVHGLLDRLPDLERRCLMLAYGIGRRQAATKDQIAARMNISPQKVRSVLQSGIMRLRWDAVRGKA